MSIVVCCRPRPSGGQVPRVGWTQENVYGRWEQNFGTEGRGFESLRARRSSAVKVESKPIDVVPVTSTYVPGTFHGEETTSVPCAPKLTCVAGPFGPKFTLTGDICRLVPEIVTCVPPKNVP